MTSLQRLVLLAAIAAVTSAQAHVVLPAGGATAGSTYRAAFKVRHACRGATSTTALAVHLPEGFTFVSAEPRAGWTLKTGLHDVTWTADSAQSALPGTSPESFTVVGRLTNKPGTLWFHALQTCDVGTSDWAVVPSAEAPKPEYPAPHLDVLAPGVAAIDVSGAWARATVPGQTSTAIYAKITAPSGAKLVSAKSPLGDVSLHEMHMEGDVMRMRDIDSVDLPPSQAVQFAPNGLHLMLTDIKQPLAAGAAVPVTLRVVDRDGKTGELSVQVPVTATPPAGVEEHHHHG